VIHNFGGFYGYAYHFGARAGGLTTSAYNRQAVIAAQTFGQFSRVMAKPRTLKRDTSSSSTLYGSRGHAPASISATSFTNEFDKFAALTNISYLFVSFSDTMALSSLALLCFDLLIHKVLLIE
jgi:hypothetical protein